ncbi:LuxR C-terminal-related transcriptional regulator [Streptomyces purpurascens]|uniref:LuxR C-terminal-related transcriptional regulator n=1 Tax=Streptomyces purpurascens TaxID=1924 RepID=UPI00167B63A1|nr:LuxR C-terminal-related transcriptional regulator [Streptomyces purpurascens]MCE7046192.1 LuxR C-terminal-related transcriptional regulator [Streptomyces purpurascens]GHA34276.1 transcriptional regulator [Streptomyces purpurascens]
MAVTEETGAEPASARVDPTGDPLLRTRFAPPKRPATFLRRSRLVRHLDQALGTPLTMVNGAAGAGKTLLVADWAAGLTEPVAWLTTDTADQAPGIFWAYLLEALRAAGVPVTGDVGCPAEAAHVDQRTLTCLAADLERRDHTTVVVLDEFDRVTSREIAEQLQFVLHHAGRGMRLVLVSRTEPLLPLHRYRASGEITEIRNAELAFTSEEAHELLSRHGLHLGAGAVRALVERTQGWAAGLRLCALAARQGADADAYLKQFEADHSAVADFLLAEVLDRQPPGTQDLLLRISVLDRCCPDLVNALTLRTDAEPILAALQRENAFVHYLGHSWYSLHPLFAEILRAHLRERFPGLEPELRSRAAQWLRRSGALPDALVQGAAADDWEFTARAVVDDLAIGQLFTGLRSEELSALFARMSPEATGPAPDLVRAARELGLRDLDHGLEHLRRAEEALGRDGAGAGAGAAPARLSSALLEALAARLTGSPDRAERAAEQARLLRREVPGQLLDEHPEITALLLTHLGSARLWAGRFDDARTALSAVAGSPDGAATALPRWEALGHLALIDYLNGRPGPAEHKALAAAGQAERYSLPQRSLSGIGPLVLAAVLIDRDELDEAQALLDEAAVSQPLVEDPVVRAGRALTRGRLFLARGDARAALAAAADATVPAAVSSPWAEDHAALLASAAHLAEGHPEPARQAVERVAHHRRACAVEAARVRLAAGHPEGALDLLDSAPENDRPGPAVTVRATLVRARAALDTGDPTTARRLVARALLDGRRERLRRPFLEAGPWIRPLLSTGRPRELAAGWLLPGLGRYRAPGPAPPDGAPGLAVEELSARERDVVRRVAEMRSTEEIAADLHVSVNTVKTHLKSIYRKLAVTRRGDAVRRARERRLL